MSTASLRRWATSLVAKQELIVGVGDVQPGRIDCAAMRLPAVVASTDWPGCSASLPELALACHPASFVDDGLVARDGVDVLRTARIVASR